MANEKKRDPFNDPDAYNAAKGMQSPQAAREGLPNLALMREAEKPIRPPPPIDLGTIGTRDARNAMAGLAGAVQSVDAHRKGYRQSNAANAVQQGPGALPDGVVDISRSLQTRAGSGMSPGDGYSIFEGNRGPKGKGPRTFSDNPYDPLLNNGKDVNPDAWKARDTQIKQGMQRRQKATADAERAKLMTPQNLEQAMAASLNAAKVGEINRRQDRLDQKSEFEAAEAEQKIGGRDLKHAQALQDFSDSFAERAAQRIPDEAAARQFGFNSRDEAVAVAAMQEVLNSGTPSGVNPLDLPVVQYGMHVLGNRMRGSINNDWSILADRRSGPFGEKIGGGAIDFSQFTFPEDDNGFLNAVLPWRDMDQFDVGYSTPSGQTRYGSFGDPDDRDGALFNSPADLQTLLAQLAALQKANGSNGQ